jgi:chromate reductase
MTARILGLAGSARKASVNRAVARAALDGASSAGADVTWLELADYPLPLYNGDIEAEDGFPENVVKLREIFDAHDGLIIGAPEYNSSITPLLKNTIDWISRPDGDRPALKAFAGKVAGLVSASGGPLGGLRGLVTVRSILGNIGVIVLPQQLAVGGAPGKITDGIVTEEAARNGLETIGRKVAETAIALKA